MGGKPGEPDKCGPDTPTIGVPEDPRAGATSPGVALSGTSMPAPHLTIHLDVGGALRCAIMPLM
jgi:hypothetical protein